ncbi:hypothetical protein HO133_007471 [Letharia lupina]|uniref:Transport protein particle subunit trs85-2 n=1 Tax=Letharia lupina TaxID=560253 RepID=A0A8H6FIW1_9LECA|nr:uncharacterized protein HO133_007471 [Letharia lupina]KAF6229355.1 hypothetical protein HO133_007471 [Letharia lupina]
MTPLEHENGNPGGISQRPQPELALRSSREFTSSDLPNNTASNSSSQIRTKISLSSSESRLPLIAGPSLIYKSRSPSNLRSQSHERSSSSSRGSSSTTSAYDSNETHRQIIVRSFAPRVAVFASSDTEDFVKQKGFKDGLYSLLRPYGEHLHGKVVIRDSMGGSRGWDDFGIRIINSQALQTNSTHRADGEMVDRDARNLVNGSQRVSEHTRSSHSNETVKSIDRVLDRYLRTTDAASEGQGKAYVDLERTSYGSRSGLSPLYPVYLRKLLSSASIAPYETFLHPVACLIAVSSHHPAPIEALRQLYSNTGHESQKVPAWMGMEYLRYYVLIHDEENDDITKSTALFDLMKRHFGLHCHLLRLRRSQCVLTDDDSTRVPSCEWLSAEEEIEKLSMGDDADDVELSEKYILESDSTAIKNLLREMVTQSIVPFMESRVMTWNDQVASRRRGIGGRFISLSKRWTGFGTAKSTTLGLAGVSNPSGSNYDYQQGFYPPETPESTMRQLGDYAFMLRDWKLASSTYDFLRADFGHDKAWGHHAAANEMAAITSLLVPHAFSSKSRSELLDQMLENAAYSYLTRCSMPFNVIRCLTIAIELLKNRGPVAADDAARWGGKLLEFGVLTLSAQALTTERVAECYISRTGPDFAAAGTRKRQAALWTVLASDSWLRLDRPDQARVRLREASALYGIDNQDSAGLPFPSMQGLWQRLNSALRDAGGDDYAALIDTSVAQPDFQLDTAEEKEQLNAFIRPSILSSTDAEGFTPQDAGHIHPTSLDDSQLQDDGFE